jgi:hypothetical protein
MHRTTIMLPERMEERAKRRARQLGVSLGEFIRDCISFRLKGYTGSEDEDSLFSDLAVYDGPGTEDSSEHHDDVVYGEGK